MIHTLFLGDWIMIPLAKCDSKCSKKKNVLGIYRISVVYYILTCKMYS